MESKTVEVYIWPLFKNDPRVVSISQYYGKFHENAATGPLNFKKKDFSIIYLDFPKFVRPFAHILKTPQSYRDFLRVKHPDQDINSLYEIFSVYSTSMEDLDQIVNSLRDKDYYFLEVEKKRREKEIIKLQMEQDRSRAKSISTKGTEIREEEKDSLKKGETIFNGEEQAGGEKK
jgi:hypothetical protein